MKEIWWVTFPRVVLTVLGAQRIACNMAGLELWNLQVEADHKWILRQLPNQVTTNEIQNLLLLKIGVLQNWI